ncbi:transposable element Tcb1 transposase [Trichonephila clavipes]|nr:transposable element Tcb1 transposase [Trichonephila clavipes]
MWKGINKHSSQQPEIPPGSSNQEQTRRPNPPHKHAVEKQKRKLTEPKKPLEVLTEDTVQLRGDREIGSRVGRNQKNVMQICDRWMQEGPTDRRGRPHPPQGTTSLSVRTILCRLQQSGLSVGRPLLGLPLTQSHTYLHHEWCDERRMWVAEWNEVVFTDESRLYLYNTTMITPPSATPDQLWQLLEAAWSAVPQEHIQSLFESMPKRVAVVISNNGGYSGY